MVIKDLLLPEYDHEIGTTRKLLDRLGDDRLRWKPHDKSMSLGGLATHIANLPNWTGTILDSLVFDLDDAPPTLTELTSGTDIRKQFDDASAHARPKLNKTDAEYLATWTFKNHGKDVFTMPRIMAFRSFVMNHLVHHRGQLSVYLRLNDIPVPAIYGPSADEG